MNYIAYRMHFPVGVHIGNGSLEDGKKTFGADTLFSALCIEAGKRSIDDLNRLIKEVKEDKLYFSDAMPFIGKRLYLPKPLLSIQGTSQSNSSNRKAYNKLEYIAFDKLNDFLNGNINPIMENNYFKKHFGRMSSRVLASISMEEETVPYRVGTFQFYAGSGLYVIVGYEHDEVKTLVEDLLIGLGYAGIGGKRSDGLGRFNVDTLELDDLYKNKLQTPGKHNVSLSVCLPTEEEMANVLENANYVMEKKSGFVASESYADTWLRKKDLFVFKAGACFEYMFKGDIFDVSNQGRHPVYRYAKPLFMGVDI